MCRGGRITDKLKNETKNSTDTAYFRLESSNLLFNAVKLLMELSGKLMSSGSSAVVPDRPVACVSE